MMILLLFNFFRYAWSQFPTYAENTTDVLDKLLTGYRKEIRPGFGGPPLVIETDILIRSIGQISESDMDYSFQCYFRQRWTDERLQFDIRNISEVTLNNLFLENIWKPNTYFLNGQKSHQHNIPRPNLFVRIRSDGRVYLSRRLTVKAACPMKLNLYPMDRPICSLVLGSYGYTTDDIVYLWKYGNNISVEVNKDVRLAQFDLISVRSSNHTDNTVFGTFSVLKVYIYFERHLGFFVLQTYLPCSMITCLSWVSFWINRDAAPARVLLGVTTILATAGIGMTVREGLPRVSYATALDTYLNACVLYEMAAMIEYAAVNYFTKVLPVDGGVSSDEDEEEIVPLAPPDQSVRVYLYQDTSNGQSVPLSDVQPTTEAFQGTTSHRKTRNRRKKESSFSNLFFKCLTGNLKYRTKLRERGNAEAGNSASNIDVWCRYLFPGTFLVFNVSYWICYLAIL
ncbi:gamma-aminobutyric acid receptor subunit alpha-6-like isoform X1 [Ruditapes philippinarum]|uniref:gamma-aminobutyric acid receptor subunit alpha-6-like isoform X1 n=1 Tax=Ruditapes philippinarum TaxID=129788 RepID=UPI00295B5270|nr:gamma-aminobutyric acid receptor subunit alpha-6-like isoform X1 [Ruditapes philippinarum]